MKCYFAYCIYNENYICLLKETRINSLGMCDECIMISISDTNLKTHKEEQLRKIEYKEKSASDFSI